MSDVPADAFVTVDGAEIHYASWGSSNAPTVVCVHGLSRVGRDFDPLARELCSDFRVLCPDLPGRGLSQWKSDLYGPEELVGVVVGLCEELDVESMGFVGTSMGGRLGLALATGPLADRIDALVMNDVGPTEPDELEEDGVQRIVDYLTDPPTYDTLSGLESYYRDTYADFGEMTADEWRRFTLTSARRRDDGKWTPAYDPRIVEPVVTAAPAVDHWSMWNALDVPILVLRGEHSDVLAADTYEEMLDRRPETHALPVEGCGHAPALNTARQVDAIRSILQS